MAAVSIVGTSQRVVDAPGLTIDELAGTKLLLMYVWLELFTIINYILIVTHMLYSINNGYKISIFLKNA